MKKVLGGVALFTAFVGGLLVMAYYMYNMLAPLMLDNAPLICRTVTWVEEVPHIICTGKNLAGGDMVSIYRTREAYERLRVLADQMPERVQWIDKSR